MISFLEMGGMISILKIKKYSQDGRIKISILSKMGGADLSCSWSRCQRSFLLLCLLPDVRIDNYSVTNF